MSGFPSDFFFPSESSKYLSSYFHEEALRYEMWQDQSMAAVTGRISDTTWDIATLEARIGSDWDEIRSETAGRIQDLALEISDHRPGAESRWPFDHSPCRLFGSRRRKRNSLGEFTMHRHCNSLPASVEFDSAGVLDDFRQPSEKALMSERISRAAPVGYNQKTMGRHRSFDELEVAALHKSRSQHDSQPSFDRPGIYRAMSIDEVQPPDQLESATKRRRGRKPVSQPQMDRPDSQPQTEEGAASIKRPHRNILMLLRNKQQISEEDLKSKENRKILHCLVYQQKLCVSFQDLVDHVEEDIENDPEEAFLRPPIPMFLDC